jgi:hypothetical protein
MTNKPIASKKIWSVFLLLLLLLPVVIFAANAFFAHKKPIYPPEASPFKLEETTFTLAKSGRSGTAINGFSVSPDGKKVLFNTNELADGLWLLDTETHKEMRIPSQMHRYWKMTNWSHDGKQVVAVSLPVSDPPSHNDYKDNAGTESLLLIDPKDWSYFRLQVFPGVIWHPFFSADGKLIYYFKGKKRESGKTIASKFDLYSYDLTSHREKRLTYEESYSVYGGYDNGQKIFFSAYGLRSLLSYDPSSFQEQTAIYIFDKENSRVRLRLMPIDQRSGFFNLSFEFIDKTGNIYFSASTKNPNGGNYLRFIYRCNSLGEDCAILKNIWPEASARIAYETGDIFVNGGNVLGEWHLVFDFDKRKIFIDKGGEMLFQRLRIEGKS